MIGERGPNVTGKICGRCGEWKPLELLVKSKKFATGRKSLCKQCDSKAAKLRRAKNADEINARRRESYDPEKAKISNAKWAAENQDKLKASRKDQWAKADKDVEREKNRRWIADNPEKAREIWRRKDEKKRSMPKGRLDDAMARGVHRGLVHGAKSGRRTFDLLGYTVNELMDHLEKQFTDGMSWSNYGKGGWEIDHVIPRSAFNYETPQDIDFMRCWALSNLQPLWCSENRAKRNKLEKPFQPSLSLAIRPTAVP